MSAFRVPMVVLTGLLSAAAFTQTRPAAQSSTVRSFHETGGAELRAIDTEINQLIRQGQLVVSTDRDPSVPSRTIERMQQVHKGVPVFGMTVVRDSDRGLAVSVFGTIAPDLDLSVEPSLRLDDARAALIALGGDAAATQTNVELSILPLADGSYRLTYTAVIAGSGRIMRIFIDAHSGAELLRVSEVQTQSAVGTGHGVLGDTKKLSVLRQSGTYMADDKLRPPVLTTFDFRENLARARAVIERNGALLVSDVAADTDNDWRDVFNVDAHVHVGWTYDYYFKRFGRRGLDNRDRPVVIVTNAVSQQGALSLSPDLSDFAINAFWCDTCGANEVGLMFFGNGIPPNFYLASTGSTIGYLAGALDIAAHELTHGVTASSSDLIYLNESGALNEAFSDIMGTSVEFFYQPAGSGPGKADYLVGEDVIRAVQPGARDGIRSLQNPALFGDPDHYSRRYRGPLDGGGVHTNSGIANHAFYLAVEGGVNATSGLGVEGVGAANRQQIENIFYRAFVFLMPSSATFSIARAATVQAARDLYGAGSAAERAVTQAWTAVGVI